MALERVVIYSDEDCSIVFALCQTPQSLKLMIKMPLYTPRENPGTPVLSAVLPLSDAQFSPCLTDASMTLCELFTGVPFVGI